jgi:hypothetical protein
MVPSPVLKKKVTSFAEFVTHPGERFGSIAPKTTIKKTRKRDKPKLGFRAYLAEAEVKIELIRAQGGWKEALGPTLGRRMIRGALAWMLHTRSRNANPSIRLCSSLTRRRLGHSSWDRYRWRS